MRNIFGRSLTVEIVFKVVFTILIEIDHCEFDPWPTKSLEVMSLPKPMRMLNMKAWWYKFSYNNEWKLFSLPTHIPLQHLWHSCVLNEFNLHVKYDI